MKTAIIIPSRYNSMRLPQKALHDILGKSLVRRVYEQCSRAIGIDAIYIATDHERIAEAVREFGAGVIMTDPNCPSGTDRVAQAAQTLGAEYEVIINVQGDEPLIAPEVIELLAGMMRATPQAQVGTPITELTNPNDLENPSVVKVVRNIWGDALYFSRLPIPYLRDHASAPAWELLDRHQYWKHIGLYAYRRAALDQFASLRESALERAERLEQLRFLEYGIPIRCVEVEYESVAVDTIEDVAVVEAMLKQKGLK